MRRESTITLQRLQLLVALAEAGSVTAAARVLGISQPALSQNLRVIERHYGFPLLMRAGRRVVLTQRARGVVDYARRILTLVGESERAVRDLVELRAGSLAVAGDSTVATYLLPRAMADFRALHPGVELRLRMGDARAVDRWVLAGEVEVGVVGEVAEPLGAAVRPYRRDALVAVVPPGHPLAAAARLDGATLATHPLIVREPGSSTRQTLERGFSLGGLMLHVLFELPGTEAILQAVAAGLGVALVSELALTDLGVARRLRVRRVAGLDLTRYLGVVTHPDAEAGPAAREFIAALRRGVAPPTIPAA